MNVDHSANVKILDDRSPLLKVLTNFNQVRVLLEKGEDPNGPIRPSTGRPSNYITVLQTPKAPLCQYPIEVACGLGNFDIVKLLLQYGATLEKRNCLHAAAGRRGLDNPKEHIKILEFLLDQGLDINKVEYQDNPEFPLRYASKPYGTPLHYAASKGYEDRVKLLLGRGADPNVLAWDYVMNEDYGTALDWQMWEEEGGGSYSTQIRDLLKVGTAKLGEVDT